MSESNEKVIRVGSRKSELALIQTKHVISRLQTLFPDEKFEIHTMSTIGDRVLNVSLPKIGEKSLFTRDLEDALRNGGVDFVVHSLKDLPTALPPGMAIGAVLEREDARDALVLNEKHKGETIGSLPKGSVIGTSSLRRTAQLRRLYPHLEVCDIRGNLNTRLAKLDAATSKFAGIILAQAGLLRMGWTNRISQILEPVDLLYAVGQGALAVECRSNDEKILQMLQSLMCLTTSCRILAERSFLKTLGGGCSAPVAVCTNLNGSLLDHIQSSKTYLNLTGAVWSLDGQTEIRDIIDCCLNLDKRKTKANEHDNNTDTDADTDNDDVSPRKRAKADEDENSNKKRSSPKVISDDKFTTLAAGDASKYGDIQHLIDIHGELFKRCPFYAMHQKEREENGNETSTKIDECPLNIPVGQDFMGKCPYVDTEKKVELSQSGKCPITGKTQPSATTSKCPFNPTSKLTENVSVVQPELGHESCPFLQKNIKMIDYGDEEKPQSTEILPCLIDDSEDLFCGLYRHKCYSHELFVKCEELGRTLAENLIRKGALDIMKCAQQEIREKA